MYLLNTTLKHILEVHPNQTPLPVLSFYHSSDFCTRGFLSSSEYCSQLPSDGGAFYTNDTMDSSRPYYKKAWPPILYAASLWLKETGFINVDKDNSRPANMKVDVSDTNRFHLLIGVYDLKLTKTF